MNDISKNIVSKIILLIEINEEIKKTKRVFECCLCNKNHSITKCEKYYEIKKDISKNNYILTKTNKIKKNDEKGFCASGIIPYVKIKNKIYMLVLIEKRDNSTALNFIGGKRECVKINNIKIIPETSFETAIHEFEEELSEILTKNTFKDINDTINKNITPTFVFWSSECKMSIYGIKISKKFLNYLKLNNEKKFKIQGYKWIKHDGNKCININYPFHNYSKNILNDMKKISYKKNLNNLFR